MTDALRLKKWTPVLIEWVDSAGDDGRWRAVPKKSDTISGCTSIGFLLHITPEAITIAHTRDKTNGHVMAVLSIPVTAVRNVEAFV